MPRLVTPNRREDSVKLIMVFDDLQLPLSICNTLLLSDRCGSKIEAFLSRLVLLVTEVSEFSFHDVVLLISVLDAVSNVATTYFANEAPTVNLFSCSSVGLTVEQVFEVAALGGA